MATGNGRHEHAFRHLRPVFEEAPAFHRFMPWSGVLDLAEAGGRSEHGGWVAGVIDELESIGRQLGAPSCATPPRALRAKTPR
jgi:hypothetical protein